jgi:hypothetical protein
MYAKQLKDELLKILDKMNKLEQQDIKANDIAASGDKTFIRVHWVYAENAKNNPNLKKVCTWSNGDEGYVAVK